MARQRPRIAKRAEADAASLGRDSDHSRIHTGPRSIRPPGGGVGIGGSEAATDLRQFVDERLAADSHQSVRRSAGIHGRYVVTASSVCAKAISRKPPACWASPVAAYVAKCAALKVSIDTCVQIEGEPLEVLMRLAPTRRESVFAGKADSFSRRGRSMPDNAALFPAVGQVLPPTAGSAP